MGESGSAAIGLLAMSLPEEEVAAKPVAALAPGGELTQGGPLQASFEHMAWARRSLPDDKSPQFKRLLQAAALAYCSAVEAEAPVLETARQLAAKQAVLSRSLSEALRANNELEEYIRQRAATAVAAVAPPGPCPKRLKKATSL